MNCQDCIHYAKEKIFLTVEQELCRHPERSYQLTILERRSLANCGEFARHFESRKEAEIIVGILRVEKANDVFRRPNPNGLYPVCKPSFGQGGLCIRCNGVARFDQPCPAVPLEERWGRDALAEVVKL